VIHTRVQLQLRLKQNTGPSSYQRCVQKYCSSQCRPRQQAALAVLHGYATEFGRHARFNQTRIPPSDRPEDRQRCCNPPPAQTQTLSLSACFFCLPACLFSPIPCRSACIQLHADRSSTHMHTSAALRSWTSVLDAPLLTNCRSTSRRVVRPGQRQGERHKHGQQACGDHHTMSAAVSLQNPQGFMKTKRRPAAWNRLDR